LGYSVSGNTAYFPYRELVYSSVAYFGMNIETRLGNLSSDEENRVTTFYLPNLMQREQDIQDATANLDTSSAAVWTHNPTEMDDRVEAFNALRIRLCNFLGFQPGSDLRSSNRLSRA